MSSSPSAENESQPQMLPLTEGQESIYILSGLANGAPVYNMPFAFRLRGPLNLRAFHAALSYIVSRHPALRSNIVETEQGLRRWTWSEAEASLEFHDLAALGEGALAAKLKSLAGQPFDLARQSPFRADLIKLSDEDHVSLFSLHHTFGDMTSMRVLARDFEHAYNASLNNEEPQLPAPADKISLDSKLAENSLEFWRRRLGKISDDFELPTDHPRSRMPSFRGAAHYIKFPNTLVTNIKALARAQKSSPYMAFLALLQALIYRYANQQNFSIATPFTLRQDIELENTVGYLINLLPIPCSVNPRANFRELLAETRKTALEVFGHQAVSMRQILQATGIPADSPRNALNRVVFQYFAEGALELNLQGAESVPIRIHTGSSKFDLSVSMSEHADGVETEIEYDSDLFSPETIERLGQHLVNLAEAVVRAPDEQICQLNFLTAFEKCFIAEINETKTSYPRDASIQQLFEQQAANYPNKIALSFEGTSITYSELNRRAEQVAQFLIKRGVRNGDFVGICIDRSPGLVAGLIGILKAGGAFVPFDPKYPEARLKYLFEDAGVRLLLTSAAQKQIAPPNVDIALIEETAAEILDDSIARPFGSPDALAYMMYTSGSTGNPKGVTVPHRAVVRLVKNNDFAAFSQDDIFLLFAPVSFDASTLEIWGPLLNGATLAIYPPHFESLEQFEAVLAREKVTKLWLTSGFFNTVVDKKIESLRNLRQLLVGGDIVSPAHVQRVYAANPNVEIINGYGPTENTTFTCCYTIPRNFDGASIPIGRPIRNTQIYVLDENLQPMPAGVPGELYCGGDGLSHGYWNKADLTQHAFVAHPFFAGARLYKTGDRVRLLKDGNLEFLGRFDSQIKIRGFRIELGEIETALRALDGVQDAAALVENAADGKRLHGFVIAQPGRVLQLTAMHDALRQALPEHACPSRIHVVEKFPLGPNGKVDKKALLALGSASAESIDAGPLGATEAVIARVWREILDVPALAPNDNFFHFGGDSLRAIQAILQINRTLNANLTVTHIFEKPTVRALAQKVDSQKTQAAPGIRQAPIQPRSREIAALSDNEVDAMLNELLSKK